MDGVSPRRRLVSLLAAAVLVLVLGGVAVRAATRTDPAAAAPPPAPARQRPGPVLLLPGYGGSTSSLERLAVTLRAHTGRDVRVVRAVGDGTGDLTVQAKALAATVDALIRGGAPSVDVVGYSAGGVVARLWAARFGGAAQARRVITLGSPHQGTAVADLAQQLAPDRCPTACRQLAPDSDLLRELPQGAVPGPAWLSLWTSRDDVVTPPSSGRLPGAVEVELQSICPDDQVRHSGLPDDPLVAGIVAAALGTHPLTAPPDATQCAALRRAGRAA
jgi:triacylglycerol esterase/lipase EstA (alpha/beta hydrolase family)